jgi:hypothetical protein
LFVYDTGITNCTSGGAKIAYLGCVARLGKTISPPPIHIAANRQLLFSIGIQNDGCDEIELNQAAVQKTVF